MGWALAGSITRNFLATDIHAYFVLSIIDNFLIGKQNYQNSSMFESPALDAYSNITDKMPSSAQGNLEISSASTSSATYASHCQTLRGPRCYTLDVNLTCPVHSFVHQVKRGAYLGKLCTIRWYIHTVQSMYTCGLSHYHECECVTSHSVTSRRPPPLCHHPNQ